MNLFILLMSLLTLLLAPGIGRCNWQSDLEGQFDIVSTFDELRDWTGMAPDRAHGGGGNVDDISYMPKTLDGSRSIWNYYSYWGTVAPENRNKFWVKDFHNPGDLGKTCAIRMVAPLGGDISSNKAPIGPSRIGIYFGEPGNPESGYSEIFVFYRVKIPRNMWPTDRVNVGGNSVPDYAGNYEGKYVDGKPYTWWASWKFFNIGTGFTGPYTWHDAALSGRRRYGDTEILYHLKVYGSGPVINHLETQWQTEMWWADDKATSFPTDQWAAVEYHFVLEHPSYSGKNGTAEAWIYDANGNGTKVMERHDVRFRSDEFQCLNGENKHKFNKIVIGGNNSETYYCGAGMDCTYYIDDVIIDDHRIGPTYFQLLSGNPQKSINVQDVQPSPGTWVQ